MSYLQVCRRSIQLLLVLIDRRGECLLCSLLLPHLLLNVLQHLRVHLPRLRLRCECRREVVRSLRLLVSVFRRSLQFCPPLGIEGDALGAVALPLELLHHLERTAALAPHRHHSREYARGVCRGHTHTHAAHEPRVCGKGERIGRLAWCLGQARRPRRR